MFNNLDFYATKINDSLDYVPTSDQMTYGSSTVNYILNDFIPNEIWKDKGDYYLCEIMKTISLSSCYVSDDPENFRVYLHLSGSYDNPTLTGINIRLNPIINTVYEYRIKYGDIMPSSGYADTSDIYPNSNALSIKVDHSRFDGFLRTNVPYFKVADDDTSLTTSFRDYKSVKTIKTLDNYLFNKNDIMFYKVGDDYVGNSQYKTNTSMELDITLEDYKLFNDYYKSKTYKINFSEFDTSQYRYYYTFDPEDFDSQITRMLAYQLTENDTLLTFETNTTIYFKVKDYKGNDILTNSYEINDIMQNKYDNETLDVLDTHPDLPNTYSEENNITDENSVGDVIGWFKSLIDKRLPILNQINGIYKAFKFNIEADSTCLTLGNDYVTGSRGKQFVWRNYCNSIPRLDFNGFLGITDKVTVIDFSFYWLYREEIFFWIKLCLGSYTIFKLIRIIPNYFKN